MIGLSLSDVGQMGRLRMMEVDDDFNRSGFSSFGDGLGVSPQGLPWEQLRGQWRIDGGRANTSTTRGSNPISRIFVGSPNIDAEIWLSNEGGDCIYFRVQDEDNWWRVRQRRWQEDEEQEYTERIWRASYRNITVTTTRREYTFTASYWGPAPFPSNHRTCNEGRTSHTHSYHIVGWATSLSDAVAKTPSVRSHSHTVSVPGSCDETMSSGTHTHPRSDVRLNTWMSYGKTYRDVEVRTTHSGGALTSGWTESTTCPNPASRTISGRTHTKSSSTVTQTRQMTRMVTVTKRGYYLERCIGGQIEQIAETKLDVGRIRVIANGDSITLRDSGSSTNRVTIQDSTHMNVPFHGIGLGASELGGSSLQRVRFRPIELL